MADTNINITASLIDGNLVNTSTNSSITITPYVTEVTTPGIITQAVVAPLLNIALSGYGEASVPTRGYGDTKRESISSLDTFRLLVKKAVTETATAQETFTKLVTFKRNLVETATATETIAKLVTFKRTVTETVSATDDFGGVGTIDDDQVAVFIKPITETTTSTDTELLKFVKAITSDTSTFSETFSRLVVFNRTITDTAASSDTKTVNLIKPFTLDTTTVNETFSRLVIFNRIIADTTTSSDTETVNLVKAFTLDTATAGETFSRLVTFKRIVTDTVSVTDDFGGVGIIDDDQVAIYIKPITETTTVSESKLFTFQLAKTETATFTEIKMAHYNNYNASRDYMDLYYVGTELTL